MAAGLLIVVNVGVTQLLWFKKIRAESDGAVHHRPAYQHRHVVTERFVIVVGSLYQDFLPANWGKYHPDALGRRRLYVGSLGAFFMMYLLFVKFLPIIAISEVKGVTPQGNPHHPLGGAKGGKS